MAHYSRLSTIVVDVPEAEHDQALGFWQAATGQTLPRNARYPEYHGEVKEAILAANPGIDD